MTQTTKIEYSHPEVLVDTQWVEKNLNDPNIRIVEVDYDSLTNYHLGHIPGAQNITLGTGSKRGWHIQIC